MQCWQAIPIIRLFTLDFKESGLFMKKNKSIIWIIVFLIVVVSPSFTYFFLGRYVDSENYENRSTASKPVLTIENYGSFPKEYEAYYNDNIPFRNQLIRFHNSIDYFVFKQSSSERVVVGKNDWLFYCDDTDGNPLEQSLGYWDFTDVELQTIADNLMSTKRILESLDIEFILFIVPNKETIYREELPDYYEVKNYNTSTDQLVEYLVRNTDIRVVYPKPELLQIKEEKPDLFLYHKLDTHWNYVGAYMGAKSLAEELGIEMPSLDEVDLEPVVSSSGDLANMLNIGVKDADIDYRISGISTLDTVNEKWDIPTEFIYHTAGADSRRLFVRRDSFSNALAPNLATQFENSMWVRYGNFDQQQIFDYGADIFVLEVVERYERSKNGLENFRISLVSSAVENDENGTKRISMIPAVSKADLQYVSIFKKNDGREYTEAIQVLQPFGKQMVLNVPDYETGEIYIYIFEDGSGEKILEEITIVY